VDDKQRHKRLRLLVKKLNKDRKKQNQKIDILCNDFISAQRNFIQKLGIIDFAANFYESILGTTDLSKLLYTAVEFIKAQNGDMNITFFLRQSHEGRLTSESQGLRHDDNYELHIFESERPTEIEKHYIESCFTQELMDNISSSNKMCTLEDMYAMGLNGNLNELNKISAATIPLGLLGSSLGFILVHRSSENRLTPDEISRISAVTSGLSRAITSCRTLSRTAD
jgi:hypothetical protein